MYKTKDAANKFPSFFSTAMPPCKSSPPPFWSPPAPGPRPPSPPPFLFLRREFKGRHDGALGSGLRARASVLIVLVGRPRPLRVSPCSASRQLCAPFRPPCPHATRKGETNKPVVLRDARRCRLVLFPAFYPVGNSCLCVQRDSVGRAVSCSGATAACSLLRRMMMG